MHDEPQYASHDGSALRIWTDTAKNNFISEQQGRPVYDEVIFVEVISPGSRGSQPVFEVKRNFSEEGAAHYGKKFTTGVKYDEYKKYIEDYENNSANRGDMSGTPLRTWPEISRSLAATLAEGRVYTVEALAALPDGALSIVGPDGRTWREKAAAYLAAAKDTSATTALAVENADLRDQIEALKAQLADVASKLPADPAQSAPAATTAPKAPKAAKAAPEASGGLGSII